MDEADSTNAISQGSATYDQADQSEAARRSVSRIDQDDAGMDGDSEAAEQPDLTQTDAASSPKS